MKSYTKLSLLAFAALSTVSIVGCKDDEVYDTQVTREYNIYYDGELWFNKTEDSHTYGKWNVYIYNSDNSLKGNFKTQYRFALETGNYKVTSILSPTVAELFDVALPLDKVEIPQDPEMVTEFAAADIVNYSAGSDLNIYMNTRTGLLRLRANDEKADKSYSAIKATLTTPVHSYRVIDSSVNTEGEPLQLTRTKATSGGGIGYAEDMLLIGSDEPININIDYLDADGNVLRSKPFADAIKVTPNDTITVSFALNDPNEQVIVNYNVEIGNSSWGNETQYPSVPVVVPEGYTYVTPEEDLSAVYNSLVADETVDHVKLYLKANSEYTLNANAVATISKSLTILGQEPGYGQTQASLTFGGAAAPQGDLSTIHIENVNLKGAQRFFNIRNQAFNIGELAFVNCVMDSWNGILWYQVTNADNQQTVGTMRLEGCKLTNYTAQSQSFIYPPTNKIAPINNIIFKNNVIHEKSFSTRTVLLSRLTKLPGVNIVIEGNTFIATKATEFTYFDIAATAASTSTLSVKNNVVTGATTGHGTWFKLGKIGSQDVTGNTRSKGYSMKTWGVAEPAESTETYDQILKNLGL